MKDTLINVIKSAITKLYDITDNNFTVDFPTDTKFGDFTTNVAMVLAKHLKKNPAVLAKEIADYLTTDSTLAEQFSNISQVGGYINFTISDSYLWNKTANINTHYGNLSKTEKKKVMLEYGQPNTHKLPHIGHLKSYIIGESIARILEKSGEIVMRANYQGDIGPHVAKSLYGWIQKGKPDPKDTLERVKLLQVCYQEGSRAYDEDPIAKETINDINKKIYTNDVEISKLWNETRQWSVDYYLEFEKLLDVNQTMHYWESEIWERGLQNVKDNIGKIFEESEGAIIFPGKKYGLHDRVFITKQGTPTYEAKDTGLNVQKYEDWPYDINMITTASEQNAYFDVVITAIEMCYKELKDKMKHLGFGMVSAVSVGKMSSRTGQIISGTDLINTIKNRVSEIIATRENLTEEEKVNITEIVSLGAVKFAFLKQNILQNAVFDMEESISFEGKSGPYIQYTYARIQSLIAQNKNVPAATSKDWALLNTESELELMRWLQRFPAIIEDAASTYSPHTIAEYIYQLAHLFNSYYAKEQINSDKSEALMRARRTLSQKIAITLKNGLWMLGINVIEKM